MNDLIPIHDDKERRKAVLGRDLHQFLKVKANYMEWFPRMVGYGFEEGKDFIRKIEKSTGGRPMQDHILTLDMAKEIAMIQRTDRGKQARQYFIEVERRYKDGDLSELDEARLVQRALQVTYRQVCELEMANAEMAPKAAYVDTYVADEDLIQFRTLANQLNIGEQDLRELLIEHNWIYRITGKRWSNKCEAVVTENQYRARSDKKRYFRPIPCHEAPRINGKVKQPLKVAPMGAERIAAAVKRWGGAQTQLQEGGDYDGIDAD